MQDSLPRLSSRDDQQAWNLISAGLTESQRRRVLARWAGTSNAAPTLPKLVRAVQEELAKARI